MISPSESVLQWHIFHTFVQDIPIPMQTSTFLVGVCAILERYRLNYSFHLLIWAFWLILASYVLLYQSESVPIPFILSKGEAGSQEHWNDPSLFVHICSQPPLFIAHSLMSLQSAPLLMNPVRQLQTMESPVLVHNCSQILVLEEHRSIELHMRVVSSGMNFMDTIWPHEYNYDKTLTFLTLSACAEGYSSQFVCLFVCLSVCLVCVSICNIHTGASSY